MKRFFCASILPSALAMGGCADTEGMYGQANLCAGFAAPLVDQLNTVSDRGPRFEFMP